MYLRNDLFHVLLECFAGRSVCDPFLADGETFLERSLLGVPKDKLIQSIIKRRHTGLVPPCVDGVLDSFSEIEELAATLERRKSTTAQDVLQVLGLKHFKLSRRSPLGNIKTVCGQKPCFKASLELLGSVGKLVWETSLEGLEVNIHSLNLINVELNVITVFGGICLDIIGNCDEI